MKQFEIVEVTHNGAYQQVIARRSEDELRPEVIEGLKIGGYRELSDDLEIWRVK